MYHNVIFHHIGHDTTERGQKRSMISVRAALKVSQSRGLLKKADED
jgi:hypothetical protein